MDPRLLLLTRGKPYFLAGELVITEDGVWPYSTVPVTLNELNAQSHGTSTVTSNLWQTNALAASASGTSYVAGLLVNNEGIAGFEIPYLLGQGGAATISLLTAIGGHSSITSNLSQFSSGQVAMNGTTTIVASLTVIGSQQILVNTFAGTSTITAELFVNGIRNLAATINGTSTVVLTDLSLTTDPFDSGSITHMYLFTNVGVGFDPTDTYPGADVQTFPDGHTRDDFWEYLYLFINVGVGFDPTDDASDRPDFVDQTFPDGHTAFDFWEYLYLYLNVVRGFRQQGQLVIRPGYTRGPILPGAHPPKNMPQ